LALCMTNTWSSCWECIFYFTSQIRVHNLEIEKSYTDIKIIDTSSNVMHFHEYFKFHELISDQQKLLKILGIWL
jgi:hypothetical protein